MNFSLILQVVNPQTHGKSHPPIDYVHKLTRWPGTGRKMYTDYEIICRVFQHMYVIANTDEYPCIQIKEFLGTQTLQ
jgi:hypothetical protein